MAHENQRVTGHACMSMIEYSLREIMSQSFSMFVYLESTTQGKYYLKPKHFTPIQKAALMKAFEEDPYLSIQTSLSLLREVGIPRRSSSHWFCEQRKQRVKAQKTVQCKYTYMYMCYLK